MENYPILNDVMLDIETLGNGSNAVVVSIGVVQFDLKSGKTGNYLELSLPILPQALYGGEIDQDTISWWNSQSNKAKDRLIELSSKSKNLNESLHEFNNWVTNSFTDFDNVKLWGNGATFDNVIVRNLYRRHTIEFLLPYWCDADVRTLTQLEDYDKVKELTGPFEGTKHDALNDCLHQIKLVHNAYKLIKGI